MTHKSIIKMKNYILFILSTCLAILTNAQSGTLSEKEGKLYLNNSLYSGIQKITDNENVISEYTIVDGLKDGKITHFYGNKKIKEIGYYSKNEKDGAWEKWDNNGNKIGEAHYKNGIKEGSWIVWDKNGIKRYEMFYENGNKVGTWKVWNDNGLLTQEKQF